MAQAVVLASQPTLTPCYSARLESTRLPLSLSCQLVSVVDGRHRGKSPEVAAGLGGGSGAGDGGSGGGGSRMGRAFEVLWNCTYLLFVCCRS